MFGTLLIAVCTAMHVYVFWRAGSVPLVARRVPRRVFLGAGLGLWALFSLGRVIGRSATGFFPAALEFLAMTWMGALFLMFVPLLATDLATLFGLLLPRRAPALRGWALIAGALLSALALFQGLRPPVVVEYEARLPGLPGALDGTVLVALSDMHLDSQLGARWAAARVAQVNAQRPDLVVLLGDIFEGRRPPDGGVIAAMGKLSAPMGVWAVPGNHEHHGRGDLRLYEALGFNLLRNAWAGLRPGLALAGVDDLTSARRRGLGHGFVEQALAGRPPGAAILLSHTPWQAEAAAAAGAGLMLCGHTHGGQIWPFGYLVRRRYPLLAGSYTVDGMTVIVTRGAGTWGPRMRLWPPGEILRVTLRGGGPEGAPGRKG